MLWNLFNVVEMLYILLFTSRYSIIQSIDNFYSFRVAHSTPNRKPNVRQWSFDYGQPSSPTYDVDLFANAAPDSLKYQQPNYEQITVNDRSIKLLIDLFLGYLSYACYSCQNSRTSRWS